MVSLLFASLLGAQIVESPRAYERFGNNAQVFAERIDGSQKVAVQLWLGVKGVEERPERHGFRHLLEHVMASGLDAVSEAQGVVFTAETTRNAMAFKFEVAPSQLPVALALVRDLLKPPRISTSLIERELASIRSEQALLPDWRLFSRTAWLLVFGQSGLDPFGDLRMMAKATPDELLALHQRLVSAPNTSLVLAGDLKPRETLSMARSVLEGLPPQGMNPAGAVLSTTSVRESPGTQGVALAERVPGILVRETLINIAVGLAATQFIEGSQMTYTVSTRPGLVLVSSNSPEFRERFGRLSARQLGIGVLMMQQWVAGQERTPARLANFRGSLLSEDSSASLDSLRRLALAVQTDDAVRAHVGFGQEWVVEGFR